MVSCHSFNSTEYHYNNGCVGYARDDVTMIAFTVANPDKSETLNNRKTSRQLFMYKASNGLFLQSRLYSSRSGESYGGMDGEQPESKLYRDLIQREISALENVPNLWKTYKYSRFEDNITADENFGGYCDWKHENFAPKVSLRSDHIANFRNFSIGKSGLRISCGSETIEGLYCDNCDHVSQIASR